MLASSLRQDDESEHTIRFLSHISMKLYHVMMIELLDICALKTALQVGPRAGIEPAYFWF